MKRKTFATAIVITLLTLQWHYIDDTHAVQENKLKVLEVMQLVKKDALEKYLEDIISFGPRVTGTESCRETAEYIYEKFSEMGLVTKYQNWTACAGLKKISGVNVEGILPGDDKVIIFNAHFDSVATTVGADDNAAGVSALITTAEVLSEFKFKHTIKFVAVSGEEQGLLGSNEYARRAYEDGDKIIVELNADMIGHAEGENAERKFRIYSTEDADWIVKEIDNINNYSGIKFDFVKGNITRRYGGSDYHSFAKYGFESIAFFEYDWNPKMHQPGDNISNVNINYLTNTTRIIAGTIAFLGDAEQKKPYLILSSPKRGRIYIDGREILNLGNERTLIIGKNFVSAYAESNLEIEKVEFYLDGEIVKVDTTPPYEFLINKKSLWKHEIKVLAYDGELYSTDWMNILWFNFA